MAELDHMDLAGIRSRSLALVEQLVRAAVYIVWADEQYQAKKDPRKELAQYAHRLRAAGVELIHLLDRVTRKAGETIQPLQLPPPAAPPAKRIAAPPVDESDDLGLGDLGLEVATEATAAATDVRDIDPTLRVKIITQALGQATNRQVQQWLGVDATAAGNLLAQLVSEGWLVRAGTKLYELSAEARER